MLLLPARAWAHARLKRSEPAAGSSVASAPRVLRFWFSERPELSLTVLSLKDASGRSVGLNRAEYDGSDPLAITAGVSDTLAPGRYTVSWLTAASDGHPTHGTFTFVVLQESPRAETALEQGIESSADTLRSGNRVAMSSTRAENGEEPEGASSIANPLARTFSFLGLLVLVGTAAFATLIVPRAHGIATELAVRVQRDAALIGAVAALLVIVTAVARLFLESEIMRAMPGMQTMSMADMAMHTRWGFALRLEIGAALLALVSFALASRRVRGAWLTAAVLAVALAATPALAGHAASSPRFTSLLIGCDFLHVLGASAWLGSLFVVMVIGIPRCISLSGLERWSSVAALVSSFSPIALASAGVVVVSGVVASWVHLEHASALWQTAYGQVLLVKLFLVAVTLAVGAYNFRRVQPLLSTEAGSARLKRSAVVELGTGFLILIVTGFLTGISP